MRREPEKRNLSLDNQRGKHCDEKLSVAHNLEREIRLIRVGSDNVYHERIPEAQHEPHHDACGHGLRNEHNDAIQEKLARELNNFVPPVFFIIYVVCVCVCETCMCEIKERECV